MNSSCFHILIIWSSAIAKKDYIINDLRRSFHVVRIFKIHWDAEKYFDNYCTFYSHSLRHLSYSVFSRVINTKIKHCGTDDFVAIVFEDPTPVFQERETSNGKSMVNVRVFEKKTAYRALTGGGHKIHSSDNAWETNKDLTLIFGKNTEDFRKAFLGYSMEEKSFNHNCIGVSGYKDINQFFYVLNNTIKYCVLRNFECLPHEYNAEGHGDIDLMVEDKNYMRYLTLAKPVFTEPYRVYHTIKIDNKDIPFDFRHVGDNYYDRPWEEHILSYRQIEKALFYIPGDEDLYYSLLYHAYIQKNEVKSDYIPKLSSYGKSIGVDFSQDLNTCIYQLDAFMAKEGYEYARPSDGSVVYNTDHISLSTHATRYGTFIKRTSEDGKNGYEYTSIVYQRNNTYVKRGTPWLIHNEEAFLTLLQNYPQFPTVISCTESGDIATLEQERMQGKDFRDFFSNVNYQTKRHVKSFLKEMLIILKTLNEYQICHRDVLAENIIVNDKKGKSHVSLIDFGWAIFTTDTAPKTPLHLGGSYKPPKGYSDIYTFAQLLIEYWIDVPFIRALAHILMTSKTGDYESERKAINKAYKFICYVPFTPYDELRLFLRRHQRPRMIINDIKAKWNKK